MYASGDVVKINGIETTEYISVESANGLDTYALLFLDSGVLEELGGKLTSMELELRIYDEEFNVLYEDTVKLKLN